MAGFHDEIEYARDMARQLVNLGLTMAEVASRMNGSPWLEWDYFHDRGVIYGKRNEDDVYPVNIYQVAPK